MSNKYFLKLINEELSNFDFLGNDEHLKEQETIGLFKNEDLQKQFICDSLLDKQYKVKILKTIQGYLTGDWQASNHEDASNLTIDYSLEINYLYDSTKEPLNFEIYFEGDNVGIDVDGWNNSGDRNSPPDGEQWFSYIDYDTIKVSIFTKDGDNIPFVAFERAPKNIQTLFIKSFVDGFIYSQTEMTNKDQIDKGEIGNYC